MCATCVCRDTEQCCKVWWVAHYWLWEAGASPTSVASLLRLSVHLHGRLFRVGRGIGGDPLPARQQVLTTGEGHWSITPAHWGICHAFLSCMGKKTMQLRFRSFLMVWASLIVQISPPLCNTLYAVSVARMKLMCIHMYVQAKDWDHYVESRRTWNSWRCSWLSTKTVHG